MPQNIREARLQGVQMATRLHRELDSKSPAKQSRGTIDVFGAIDEQGYGLLFRPLEGLLGLCMNEPYPGVLISTNRPLSVQRFTAAHELGHLVMGHDFSFDNEDTIWRPTGTTQAELQEVSANSFGSTFLMPKWLLKTKMEKYGWTTEHLTNPILVYQLALRVGVSYEAICNAVLNHKWILPEARQKLVEETPKSIKQSILNGEELKNPWADVWILTEHDQFEFIEAGPSDVFVLQLKEQGQGGYLWNVEGLNSLGFQVSEISSTSRKDLFDIPSIDDAFGTQALRSWHLTSGEAISGRIELEQSRPWKPNDAISQFELDFSLWGKESGLPRSQRKQLRAA